MPSAPRAAASYSRRTLASVAAALTVVLVALALPASLPAAQALPPEPSLVEQTDGHLAWTGTWATASSASLSGGSQALTNEPNASLTFAFVGEHLELIGMIGPKSGVASVVIDGGAPLSVDYYSPSTQFGQVVLSVPGLSAGLHTVVVTATGTKQPASADDYVSVDAIRVVGTVTGMPVEQSDTRIVKRGQWMTPSAVGPSGGSHMLANAVGNEIAVSFNGTRLDMIGMTGPKFGIAAVSIDGGAPVDVDLYAPDTSFRQLIFSTGELAAGEHSVTLRCTGRKNPASSDVYVGLDAVLPEGTLTQAVLRYEDTDSRLGWSGQVSALDSAGHSGGRYVQMGPGWGAVAVSFVGSRLDWVGETGPNRGIALIQIDGGSPQYLDLYSPAAESSRRLFTTGALPYGTHTVVISWTGRANRASSGSFIPIDAFDIGGEPVQATPPARPAEAASFGYPWNRYIVVDKSDFRLYFVENGLVVKTYPVAHARVGATTPNAIWRIDAKYYSDPLSVYGPRKMRLFRQQGSSYVYTSFLIHGTNNPASIGTRASAGCIRMYNHDVLELYPLVPLGTMVVTRD